MEYKKIAVLFGGHSSEREVSLISGKEINKALLELGYITKLIDFNFSISIEELKSFDAVFIALHGFEGESGKLQEALEEKDITFFGSHAKGCRKTWNKAKCKEALIHANISTPEYIITENILDEGFPLGRFKNNKFFLKPTEDGSSVDTFFVENEIEFDKAKQQISNPNREFMLEESVRYKEFTVPVLHGKALPVIEIIPENRLYDYEAKYNSDKTQLLEAQLDDRELGIVSNIAELAYSSCNCKDWARIDLVQDKDKNFFVLEINTVPGMTSHSLFPKSAAFLGYDFKTLIKEIINE